MGETRIMKANFSGVYSWKPTTPICIDVDEDLLTEIISIVEDKIKIQAYEGNFDQLAEMVYARDQLMEAKKEFENKCKFVVREEEPDGEDE